jgi:hypothetical protein
MEKRNVALLEVITGKATENLCRFEVHRTVVMKSYIFWDIMPYSLLKVNRGFGGIYRFHHQGRRIHGVRNQRERVGSKALKKAMCSFENLFVQLITRRYIQDDNILQQKTSSKRNQSPAGKQCGLVCLPAKEPKKP